MNKKQGKKMWGLEIQMIKILHSDISHGTPVCDSEKPKPYS